MYFLNILFILFNTLTVLCETMSHSENDTSNNVSKLIANIEKENVECLNSNNCTKL